MWPLSKVDSGQIPHCCKLCKAVTQLKSWTLDFGFACPKSQALGQARAILVSFDTLLLHLGSHVQFFDMGAVRNAELWQKQW